MNAIANMVAAGTALHLSGRDPVTTDLPEWRHDKGKPICEPTYNGKSPGRTHPRHGRSAHLVR